MSMGPKLRESGVKVPVECKYCHAPMIFIPMRASGKAMPCNAPVGRVVVAPDGVGDVVPTYESHFATCPHAALARKQAKG